MSGYISNDVYIILFYLMLFLLLWTLYKRVASIADDKRSLEDKINNREAEEKQQIIENAEKIIVSELIDASCDLGNADYKSRVNKLREIIDSASRR